LTLYVESNFVLEIALGQEEFAPAERLLVAAEAGAIDLALPSFSLSEPFARVTRGIRDRGRLMSQFRSQVGQLARSTPHQKEIGTLQAVPELMTSIDEREVDLLTKTVERLLASARIIELDLASFQTATDFKSRFSLQTEDAVILAVVVADLKTKSAVGRHLFANRNRKDFAHPEIAGELRGLVCDFAWSFEDATRQLGVN
jgi:predicted nucleic acid-binding protein